MKPDEVLKQAFGHTAFRPGQGELIGAILDGRDVFGVMPTGGGKSLCYQVPALMLHGVTLVVSPLISLMKDQVMALRSAGVDAAYINSSLTSEQMRTVFRNLRAGQYKIVYVAPERLGGEGFLSLAQSLPISLVAVDEAHCISQWGQDFRPSYLKIVDFVERLPNRPVLAAFTATATRQVREDVERILKLNRPVRVVTGFDRPNLNFEVLHPKSKAAALRVLLDQRWGKSGIVYCATRSGVDKLCQTLRAAGTAATRYHAGLEDPERRENQEDFLYDRSTVMVATNAFGMGIDKSNVGFVIHYNMPKSLEAYYQEAGRAGRDGEPAAAEKRRSGKSAAELPESDGGLFQALKALRFQLAKEENVPAYIIFSNATLADMAAKAPMNIEAFLEVAGVGEVKAARYGEAFLHAIQRYADTKAETENSPSYGTERAAVPEDSVVNAKS